MHRLAQAFCSLCLAGGTASAAPLALTGLSRIGGEARAFFTDGTAGGYFSLTPGEEGGGIRLLAVEFKDPAALVTDRFGTNRIVFGSKDVSTLPSPTVLASERTYPPRPEGIAPLGRPKRRITGSPVPDPAPVATTESGLATVEEGRELVALPAVQSGVQLATADLPTEPQTAAPSAADPVSPPSPPTRRLATTDELFKTRNGYAAWEELLRQRHQAEMLAISPTANENP